ncbi:MAG TPA: DUF2157 domain-containing protein [Chromatiaceae bacterium]|nr:DUF2157 domain-containing protein [Chromatiaceae bacterium]
MNQRPALYALAARHGLDAAASRRLFELAGLEAEPPGLALWLPRGLALLGAAVAGLGLILWVAANWDALGRVVQFGLLQGLVAAACLGAAALPAARPALGLLALLGIGGLLAFFGQTYQTGADAWQLFALWGLLALPLALAVCSDALWTPWAVVALTAITLWAQTHASRSWLWSGAAGPDDLLVHASAWGSAALVVAALSPALGRYTGAGVWAQRTAATLAVALVTLSALGGLFSSELAAHYWLGLLVLGGAALVLALPLAFEVGTLSAVALGLDTLLVAGLAHRLLRGTLFNEPIGPMFVLGLVAAALVAASVSVILWLARRHRGGAA